MSVLANGTRPSSVLDIVIARAYSLARNATIIELPSETCARRYRRLLHNTPEKLPGYQLDNTPAWKQLCADDVSRRQTCVTSLVLRTQEGNVFTSVVEVAHRIAKERARDIIQEAIEDAAVRL